MTDPNPNLPDDYAYARRFGLTVGGLVLTGCGLLLMITAEALGYDLCVWQGLFTAF